MVLAFPSIVSAQSTAIFSELISVKRYDSATFTQGLLLYEGILYESTGHYGESSLHKINLSTGFSLKRLEPLEKYFTEGLAQVEDRLIQLTWKSEMAFVYDINSLEKLKRFTYEGEGWGLRIE